jgi:hypothetical protein
LPGNGIAIAELGQQTASGTQRCRAGAGDPRIQLHPGEEQTNHRTFDDDAIEVVVQNALNARDGLREDRFSLHAIVTPRRTVAPPEV